MTDPLAEVVTLLRPRAPYSKLVGGAGPWRVRRTEGVQPFYCAILDGSCSLAVDGGDPMPLCAGDFVMIPAAQSFTMSGLAPAPPDDFETVPVARLDGEFRLGLQSGPPDVQLLVGHFEFGSPDAALLVSLLPQLIHVQGEKRLAALVQLVIDESRAQRPARDVILSRLLEVMLVEALRSTTGIAASPGLLRGMADERLAQAIRQMHEDPKKPWTIAQLANEAAMSRSAFFERFNRAVGAAPMEYLLAWRMALGKNMLRRKEGGVAEVAARVGYGSASAFSVAFTRHVGMSPRRYAQEQTAPLFP
jgi:AraC-like DNA-binding protein